MIGCKVMEYKVTSKTPIVLIALILALATGPVKFAFSQCKNQITMVPRRAMKAAIKPRNFVRFQYSLSPSDSLLVRSHEDTETTIGPYDLGFLIARNGKAIQSVTLRELPEFRREDSFFSKAFTTLAVTRACTSGGLIFFVTMKYMGDEISPALVFIAVPSAQGYEVSNLPLISGGIVDVSTDNPLHLRVLDSLHEGSCNACETAYRVTEYEIRDGKPIRTRQHRTKRLYSSGQFDESRIRFIP